jgi:hypothetical protein
MRSLPNGWNTLFTRLGLAKKRNKRRGRDASHRSLRMEALELRQMLSITVNTPIDERDFNLNDGDRSLRDAILEASPGETIDFDPATLNGATITLTLGEIAFGKNLTIDASMLSSLTIDANDLTPGQTFTGNRIFNITDPTSGSTPPLVALKGLTLTGGDEPIASLKIMKPNAEAASHLDGLSASTAARH